MDLRREEWLTLFLEVVIALEAGTETINGLSGFSNPKSDAVYSSSEGSHFWFRILQTICNNKLCVVESKKKETL